MKNILLYYVAVPCTAEIIDLITLFSIQTRKYDPMHRDIHGCGLFIYNAHLELESVDDDTEWLLENKDAIQVLAFYANKDFNGLCAYLNTIPERPFNVCTDSF
jgi:hypothetical protein